MIFNVTSMELVQQLRAGDLDIVVSFTPEKPERDARYHWTEELVWRAAAECRNRSPDIVLVAQRPLDESHGCCGAGQGGPRL